jgi:hypothetical protein
MGTTVELTSPGICLWRLAISRLACLMTCSVILLTRSVFWLFCFILALLSSLSHCIRWFSYVGCSSVVNKIVFNLCVAFVFGDSGIK